MTLSQKLEKLREDWIVIVLSLLAAVFLYVFYQIAQMDTTTFSVPISVESNGNLLLVKEIPSRVKITVKGKTEDISRLTEKDFSASLIIRKRRDDRGRKIQEALVLKNMTCIASQQ